MTTTKQPESPQSEELIDLEETIAKLKRQNEEYRAAVKQLTGEVSLMRKQIEIAQETMGAIKDLQRI